MEASTGIISTIAGTGVSSYSGDGGLATSATMNYPYGVAVDAAGKQHAVIQLRLLLVIIILSSLGNVYISDMLNQRIRKMTATAGTPTVIPTATPRYANRYTILIRFVLPVVFTNYSLV